MAHDYSWLRPAPVTAPRVTTDAQRADFAEARADQADRIAADWVGRDAVQVARWTAEAERLRARAAQLRG